MAISNQIARLMQAKANIAAAIENKGVTVPPEAKLDEYPDFIDQISGSGGTAKSYVNFYDYDGTLIASYTLDEAHHLTYLPTPPAHDGLTFQGWNYTLDKIKAATRSINVGATYITTDGKTHLHIRLTPISGLSITLYLNKSDSSTLTVEWGDSTTSTFTNSGNFNTGAHQYPSAGDYTIKLWISSGSGTFGFGHGTSSAYLLGNSTAQQTLISSFVGNNVTSIGNYAFSNCYSLTSITIPDSVTSISNYAFRYCYSLTSITIPDSVTSIGIQAFYNCYSLTSITIPDGVTSIGDYAFSNCYSLTSITIPDGVTSIGIQAIYNCYSIKQYIIERSVPPTLSNSNAFDGIVPCCYIYVPAASLNAYKTATNWSVYADYFIGM